MCKSSFLGKACALAPVTTGGQLPSFPQQCLEKISKIVPKT